MAILITLGIFAMWLMFAFFAMRMDYQSWPSQFGADDIVLALFCGPLGWIMSASCCDNFKQIAKAHYLDRLAPIKYLGHKFEGIDSKRIKQKIFG